MQVWVVVPWVLRVPSVCAASCACRSSGCEEENNNQMDRFGRNVEDNGICFSGRVEPCPSIQCCRPWVLPRTRHSTLEHSTSTLGSHAGVPCLFPFGTGTCLPARPLFLQALKATSTPPTLAQHWKKRTRYLGTLPLTWEAYVDVMVRCTLNFFAPSDGQSFRTSSFMPSSPSTHLPPTHPNQAQSLCLARFPFSSFYSSSPPPSSGWG